MKTMTQICVSKSVVLIMLSRHTKHMLLQVYVIVIRMI